MPPRRFDHQAALADVVRARFLDVGVFTGGTGQDGGRGVPVVRRGDEHRVHGLGVEDRAHVLADLRRLAGALLDGLGCGRRPVGIGVADVRDEHVLVAQELADVVVAHAAGADDTNVDAVIGPAIGEGPSVAEGGSAGQAQAGLLQKAAAVAWRHDGSPRPMPGPAD